jgi:hypothetical protein
METPPPRPLHTKLFFSLAAGSLAFTCLSLYRIFASTQRGLMAESVRWQRLRMIGQAGVIVGLTGSLVVEGFGWDLVGIEENSTNSTNFNNSILFKVLGLFGRTTNKLQD